MVRRLYRVGERLQDVLRFRNVPYDALLLLLDAAARLRVIGSSRRCSDSSNSVARSPLGRGGRDCCHWEDGSGLGGDVRPLRLVLGLAEG